MKVYCLFGIFIFLSISLGSFPQSAFADRALDEKLRKVEHYGKEGQLDFAFLELRDLLRQYPDSPRVPEMQFALAEYLFHQRNFRDASEALQNCLSKIKPKSAPRLLGQVYLLKCQEKLFGDSEDSRTLLTQLKHELSSQKFFKAFDDKRVYSWKSPLGNLYILHEFVDRMEIFQNGKPFYTITLP